MKYTKIKAESMILELSSVIIVLISCTYVPPDLFIHNTYTFCGTYVFKKYKLQRVIWNYKYIHCSNLVLNTYLKPMNFEHV